MARSSAVSFFRLAFSLQRVGGMRLGRDRSCRVACFLQPGDGFGPYRHACVRHGFADVRQRILLAVQQRRLSLDRRQLVRFRIRLRRSRSRRDQRTSAKQRSLWLGILRAGRALAEIADTLTFHGPISAGATATITMTATTNYSPLFNSGPDGHSGGLGYGYSGMTVYNSSGTLFSGGAICAPTPPRPSARHSSWGDISLEDTGSFNSITATIDPLGA